MRDLLYLSHRIPYPPNKGDKIRAYHELRYLQRHFRVHLGSFIDDADDMRYAPLLAADCASSFFLPLHPLRTRLASMTGLLRGEALSLPYYRHAAMQAWVEQTLARQPICAALAFSGPMAQYLPARTSRGPLLRVMDLVDVDSEKWLDYAATRPWPLSALFRREGRLLLAFERDVARRYDSVWLVSQAEAELFRKRAPESAHKTGHFSNGVDAAYFSPDIQHPNPYMANATATAARVLVFTGAMDYWPNVEAVQWFAQQVLPSLRAQCPGLQFHIVGARPAPPVIALGRLPGVFVSGSVPDIRPYLQHAALAVAPLRIARGVQNKVLEAMAMGKVVLASPQALTGIACAPGRDVLSAANAAEFITQVGAMLADGGNATPDTVHDMERAARLRILQDYQWDSNLAALGSSLGLACVADAAAPAAAQLATATASAPPAAADLPHASVSELLPGAAR